MLTIYAWNFLKIFTFLLLQILQNSELFAVLQGGKKGLNSFQELVSKIQYGPVIHVRMCSVAPEEVAHVH